jgi:hypothetical protein
MSIDGVRQDALFVYDAGMELMTFLMEHGFQLKWPPPNRYCGHKSRAERKKRRELRAGKPK